MEPLRAKSLALGGGVPEAGVSEVDVRKEALRLGRQYDRDYFEHYGRGPHQYQAAAPYQLGESVWQNYFGSIADLIAAELAPVTVLDAGCAIGFLVNALRARGIEAWGIDISDYAISCVDDAVRDFCSIGSVTDEIQRDYDLIACIEVLEHLPPYLAPLVVENFSRHTNAVLFSASADGFRDPTHLNVQPTDYWVALFARHGFFRSLDVDASIIAPQAICFLRAGQTALSVARAYERWHWRTLEELRDLRQARQHTAEEFVRAEHAITEVDMLRTQLESRKIAEPFPGWEDLEMPILLEHLEHYRTAAKRAETELALLRGTRTFRYTSWVRVPYGRLRQFRRRGPRLNATTSLAGDSSQPGIRYGIELPRPGQRIGRDFIFEVRGWALCDRGFTTRVEIVVNGDPYCRARLGIARPDVAERRLGRADAAISGFEALVDLSRASIKGESATIEICVIAGDSDRYRLDPIDVRLPSPPALDQAPNRRTDRDLRRTTPADELRVLVFTHHLGLGGGQLYLFELLRLLSRTADFSAMLVAPEDGPLRSETEALGIPVLIGGHHDLGDIEQYETRLGELTECARDGGFNAILANTLGTFPGIDLAQRMRLPAVWAIHESFDLESFWRVAYGSTGAVHPLIRSHAKAAFASAAAIVFEAEATRELFVHHGDPNRFVTVPYGIDVEEIDRYAASVSRADARRQLRLPERATMFLCLGTIEPRKGQALLAEAFASIAQEHADAVLVFVGARADESSRALDCFVRESGLDGRIRTVAVSSEIFSWYRAADAFVCASDIESLPRTVLEAMAFSVPVMATRVFGLPELIDDGLTGYLCEPSDVGELAQMLSRFLNAPVEERRAVAEAGASLVRRRHDSRSYAKTYDRILRGLVEDPGRLPSALLAVP